jgi:hypothetical protein
MREKKMTKKIKTIKSIFIFTLLISMTSCGWNNFRKSLGVENQAPDEFMVKRNKALEIPKYFSLPKPGTSTRISKKNNEKTAEELLFGNKSSDREGEKELSSLEKSLEQKIGSGDAEIRKKIEKEYENESSIFGVDKGSVAEKILDPFGYNRPSAVTIDGVKENQRIKEKLQKGEDISNGDVEVSK